MLLQGGGSGSLDVVVVLLTIVAVIAAILLVGRLFDAAMAWSEPFEDEWESGETATERSEEESEAEDRRR